MITDLIIIIITVVIYFFLYLLLKKYKTNKPIDKISWKLLLLIIIAGMPAVIVVSILIVILQNNRDIAVQKWCAQNGLTYKYYIKNRKVSTRLDRYNCKYSLHVMEHNDPIKIRIGNSIIGLINNEITLENE